MRIAPEVSAFVGKIDFDPDALHRKYMSERDKRLREDGIDQYVEVKAEFSRYIDDPYVEPGFTRAPVFDEVQFAIVGGGFGGLLMGARLREAGFEDLRIIETGGDVGGTWYWNRYPGAMCDVESYCYLPLLEELGYMPKHKYSFAPEILEHSQRIARHYRLYDNALFQTSISELRWNEDDQRWIISTNRGDALQGAVCGRSRTGRCTGRNCRAFPASTTSRATPFTPAAGTIATPAATATATCTDLKDKRVGIIGTGATAVQCIPHLGEAAKQLYVFQRTPSSIDVRNNARDRPGMGGVARAGLAKAADGELQHPGQRRRSGRRPGA